MLQELKGLLFLLMSLMVSNCVYSQGVRKRVGLVHFSVGSTFSNLLDSKAPYVQGTRFFGGYDYSTSIVKDIRVGVSIATGYEYFFRENLSVLFFLAYENKGLNLTDEFSRKLPPYVVYSYQIKVDNDYLVLPVLVRKYLGNTGFYIQAGSYFGLILRSQVQTSYSQNSDFGYSSYYSNVLDTKNVHTSDLDFGLLGGFGYRFIFKDRLSLGLDFQLNAGLIKIDKLNDNSFGYYATGTNIAMLSEKNYYGLSSNARNISASLSLGLAYKI